MLPQRVDQRGVVQVPDELTQLDGKADPSLVRAFVQEEPLRISAPSSTWNASMTFWKPNRRMVLTKSVWVISPALWLRHASRNLLREDVPCRSTA
jgi:hypothetical protein